MAARSHGNGTNFDWLRKSCDISTCDLCPDGNLEKYGRPMKSAIWPRCASRSYWHWGSHIGLRALARWPIWLSSANMT